MIKTNYTKLKKQCMKRMTSSEKGKKERKKKK